MPLSAHMLHSPLYTLACLEVGPLCSSRALSMGVSCSCAWLCVRLTATLGLTAQAACKGSCVVGCRVWPHSTAVRGSLSLHTPARKVLACMPEQPSAVHVHCWCEEVLKGP